MTVSARVFVLGGLLVGVPAAPAAEALVAVATNFAQVAGKLESAFESATEHRVSLSLGSTGKLYAQIRHGAPFDAFLAADQLRPRLLETEGRAVTGSTFTYATGRLAVWGTNDAEFLRVGRYRRLAMANPDLAPYGAAARQTLDTLELAVQIEGRVVLGENVAQVYSLVDSGNAELGFVALSSVLSREAPSKSYWLVPQTMHQPIRQDAVLLNHGRANEAAIAFLAYLKTPRAIALMAEMGYAGD